MIDILDLLEFQVLAAARISIIFPTTVYLTR